MHSQLLIRDGWGQAGGACSSPRAECQAALQKGLKRLKKWANED